MLVLQSKHWFKNYYDWIWCFYLTSDILTMTKLMSQSEIPRILQEMSQFYVCQSKKKMFY